MQKKIGVGSELDSYCGKCKLLLNHVVVAMVESDPKRVRCLTCQSEHNHRMPKPKSSGSRSRSSGSSRTTKTRSVASAAARWQALLADWDEEAAKSYSIYETFSVNDWVSHPKFGKGGVIEVPGPDRIITLFESGEKMLMQGKKRA
ncbi:MAG: hypothetical protein QNK37_06490 [Acidobacteriota bacterium]|nr:hypothetical protein [Acidobacteriota bacterium]